LEVGDDQELRDLVDGDRRDGDDDQDDQNAGLCLRDSAIRQNR